MPHVEVEYSEITPNICLGTNLCCDEHAEKLEKLGARIDISLEEKRTEIPHIFETFTWLPTEDHYPPTFNQIMVGTSILQEAEERGIRAYVHCRHGHGRSPTLVIAHFMRNKGMSYEDAFALVQERRPEIHPTEAQIAFLKECAARGWK